MLDNEDNEGPQVDTITQETTLLAAVAQERHVYNDAIKKLKKFVDALLIIM